MITTLIVDDEADMRLLLRALLETSGHDIRIVEEAADGTEALTRWRSLDPPPIPTVVILDNRMPGLTGLEVAEHILEELPDQKVVLFTAYLDDALEARATEIGVRCVSKSNAREIADVVFDLASR